MQPIVRKFNPKVEKAYFFIVSAAASTAEAPASLALSAIASTALPAIAPAASVALLAIAPAASTALSAAPMAASAMLSAPAVASAAIASAVLAVSSAAFWLQAAKAIEEARTSDKTSDFFIIKSLPLGSKTSGGTREGISLGSDPQRIALVIRSFVGNDEFSSTHRGRIPPYLARY
jgi:hypothetical protein